MKTADYVTTIVDELNQSTGQISNQDVQHLADQILASDKVFVTGAGRSGLMGKAFAMRLMHMGIDAYVVGETVTANLEEGDLLVIGTGSGETSSLIPVVQKAKKLNGIVAAVTVTPDSTIGALADVAVKLPGAKKDQEDEKQTIQPMGSLFEQTLLLFYDAVILSIMDQRGLDSNQMYGKHANLE
ncbi:6-phospho-3-hexuloisomerase [Jeotgalibacillus sp. R-1-5s-1]|uniref:6-phospho-3-hexuloisomerase n=1 Tax=Jeotgalibacillus sp. R-1-5s-1 TaxID=2555897 RepID=UPI00106C3C21|nr:6-phospho-3-hexuloisomerase [Jeotgalibacillus sp. R-1-5s-1]TFE00214.1 6-phospho-3-hexuloisomerase [Jeotgalibacillus sp. R-1-5s-1]